MIFFKTGPSFADITKKLRRLVSILPALRSRTGNRSVEEVLEELRSLQKDHPYWSRRQRELVSIRFYLQQAIWWAENAMVGHAAGVSNYVTLIGYVEEFRRSNEPVILISFNYDTLIERALFSHFDEFSFKDIQDYVRRPTYKLFKLHGSVNWGHPVEDDPRIDIAKGPEQVTNAIIELADSIRFQSDSFVVMEKPSAVCRGYAYVPAISIPVQTKSDFSCPQDWLPPLEQSLEGVTNVLVIGWRGSEEHFLNKAVPVLNKNAELAVSVVSDSAESAQDTHERLRNSGLRPARSYDYLGGFTNFIVSDDVKIFLRRGGNVV